MISNVPLNPNLDTLRVGLYGSDIYYFMLTTLALWNIQEKSLTMTALHARIMANFVSINYKKIIIAPYKCPIDAALV